MSSLSKDDITSSLAGICSASRGYKVTVFSANPSGPKRGIRRKLNTLERSKVHAVRKTGACLSCRMLKVPCDIPDPDNPGPCKRCLAIASRPHQKGLLAFRECIRTKIRDVNIFQHTLDINFTSLSSPKLISLISKTVDPVESGPSPSLVDVVKSIFTWMVPEKVSTPERSIVGALLCSDQFRQLANGDGLLGQDLLEKFRVMVYSSTLAYVYDSGSRDVYDSDLTMQDLHRITYAMGSELLLFLDNILAPHHLAKLSHEHLCGLFVLIFGIALAVAYSTSVDDSPSFNPDPETSGNTPKTLWQALQQHLSQMMSHHLVLLGSRLGLVLRGDSEREVLSSLMTGMTSRGNFVWVAQQRPVELPSTSHSSTSSSTSTQNSTPTQTTDSTDNPEELSVLIIPETETKSDPTTGSLSMAQLASYRSAPVSARSLQTVQNSLKAVLPESIINGTSYMQQGKPPKNGAGQTSSKRADDWNDVSSPTEVRRICNRLAQRKFRERCGLAKSTSGSPSNIPPVSSTSQNTESSPQEQTQSNEPSRSAISSETDFLDPFSQIPPSKQTDLFADTDIYMDLDADPFGIGWLPDPDPEPEPNSPGDDLQEWAIASCNTATHQAEPYTAHHIALFQQSPPVTSSYSQSTPGGQVSTPVPKSPSAGYQRRFVASAQRAARRPTTDHQNQFTTPALPQHTGNCSPQLHNMYQSQYIPSRDIASCQQQISPPSPPAPLNPQFFIPNMWQGEYRPHDLDQPSPAVMPYNPSRSMNPIGSNMVHPRGPPPRQYYQGQYRHNMCQMAPFSSVNPPPAPGNNNTTTTPPPANNSYFGPVTKRPVI